MAISISTKSIEETARQEAVLLEQVGIALNVAMLVVPWPLFFTLCFGLCVYVSTFQQLDFSYTPWLAGGQGQARAPDPAQSAGG